MAAHHRWLAGLQSLRRKLTGGTPDKEVDTGHTRVEKDNGIGDVCQRIPEAIKYTGLLNLGTHLPFICGSSVQPKDCYSHNSCTTKLRCQHSCHKAVLDNKFTMRLMQIQTEPLLNPSLFAQSMVYNTDEPGSVVLLGQHTGRDKHTRMSVLNVSKLAGGKKM